MTFPVLPDAEAVLVDFLATHPALAPLHGGRVGTELQATLTCLQVTALGGQQPWPWEGTPEFQISSWGGTKAEASELDRATCSAVFELLSFTPSGGGRVTGVALRLAALWSPDDQTGRPRYRSDVALTIYP